MNKQTKALEMAIEFMDGLGVDKCNCHWWEEERIEAIQACKEALELSEKQHTISDKEQPAQKPVACLKINEHNEYDLSLWNTNYPQYLEMIKILGVGKHALYTHPCVLTHSAPSWVSLSDDEIDDIADNKELYNSDGVNEKRFARAIEQKLKEKNT